MFERPQNRKPFPVTVFEQPSGVLWQPPGYLAALGTAMPLAPHTTAIRTSGRATRTSLGWHCTAAVLELSDPSGKDCSFRPVCCRVEGIALCPLPRQFRCGSRPASGRCTSLHRMLLLHNPTFALALRTRNNSRHVSCGCLLGYRPISPITF